MVYVRQCCTTEGYPHLIKKKILATLGLTALAARPFNPSAWERGAAISPNNKGSLATHIEDLSLVPGTHVREFTTACSLVLGSQHTERHAGMYT